MRFEDRIVRCLGVCVALGGGLSVAEGVPPHLGGPMKHVLITLNGNALRIAYDHNPAEVMSLPVYPCETYAAPADVLDGMAYNAQYGWLAGGFINLPPGFTIRIQLLDQTPGLETYEALTFQPIFTTGGSGAVWNWNGSMVHNWYVAREPGFYAATYHVFVADPAGQPDPAFVAADLTLDWDLAPGGCAAGDLTCDGLVSVDDVGPFVQVLLDPSAATPAERCVADANVDGTVDGRDLQPFITIVLGL
ncbi:MAG: hypothetical protein ACE5F9_06430 [Phycisphaerae bacterium]